MKLTRRIVLASAVPALALAQTETKPESKPDYLAISKAQNQRNSDALAKVPVAIETEPAFHFKP